MRTLLKDRVFCCRETRTGLGPFKATDKLFNNIEDNEKGSVQASGLKRRAELLTGSLDVLFFLVSFYLSWFPVEYFPTLILWEDADIAPDSAFYFLILP